ncbi:MAG: hypothetical protein LBT01_08840 [Spirochaetaceae bacterium]|jgi:hypothetical protein|nr:hypothetical protein [Spirochaetaceae bacterium]
MAQNGTSDPTPVAFNGLVPESIRRPEYIINLHYPRDISIGILGPGDFAMQPYSFARKVLTDLQQSKKKSELLEPLPSSTIDDIINKIEALATRKLRIGNALETSDGSISYQFRFLGREAELVGAIYLRAQDNVWKVEDIIAEDPRNLEDISKDENPYLWLPYDRFY